MDADGQYSSAGIHTDLFNHGEQNAATMYAMVEIQAGIAKENYDRMVAHEVIRSAQRCCRVEREDIDPDAKPLLRRDLSQGRQILAVVTEQDIIDAGVDVERFERYRKPVDKRKYFFWFKLDHPQALSNLTDLMELPELPAPPPQKELSSEEKKAVSELERAIFGSPGPPRKKGLDKEEEEEETPLLKLVDVDYTNLDQVCLGLKTNTTFPKVDFSANKIDCDSILAVADLLLYNTTIRWIDLSSNELLNEGLEILAQAVKSSSSLEYLDLGLVSIGLQGSKILNGMLKENRSLTFLSVSGNSMLGARGVEQICEGLQHNMTLSTLRVANTGCGHSGAELVLDLLNTNKTLTEVDLGANRINEDVLGQVESRLRGNYGHWFEQELQRAAKRKADRDTAQRVAETKKARAEAVRLRKEREEELLQKVAQRKAKEEAEEAQRQAGAQAEREADLQREYEASQVRNEQAQKALQESKRAQAEAEQMRLQAEKVAAAEQASLLRTSKPVPRSSCRAKPSAKNTSTASSRKR
mmetsp:Transcript_133262/g.231149  ORF Transcript_133262/g.231149 Transcript_133262/m.231149 type:complete len:527 (-) Transcript_133262:1031-2611(-)